MYGPHRYSFRDPNNLLDQATEMDPETRLSFYECLERIASHNNPLADPDVTPLRDPRYPGGLTATFEIGIVAFTGPHHHPPVAFIELVDLTWLDGDDDWAN